MERELGKKPEEILDLKLPFKPEIWPDEDTFRESISRVRQSNEGENEVNPGSWIAEEDDMVINS